MTATEFGKRVKSLRGEAGLSQLELALRCGYLSSSYIGFIEQGKRVPTLTTMSKIAHGLGIKLGALLGEAETRLEHDHDPSMNRIIAYASALTPHERDDMVNLMKLIVKRFSR